ncbi:MAG: 1-(5-phosphoribosyl)-5-[(5-phosphoribosylamino)methylideneamino]imidazole-4-carboxamide isomerase [Chloroflexota bacterium]
MLVIPAIDLRAGRTVRLLRGDFAQETVYASDPIAVAQEWTGVGASMLHVVDLDGAREGRPMQLDIVRGIARVASIQLGGGLRTAEDIDSAIGAGVQRVVLGTAALDIERITEVASTYGERLIVALDTRAGRVSVAGWRETSDWTTLDLARMLTSAGVQRFLHTDIDRDGALTAPNFGSLSELIALGVPVIASGGVASLQHLRRLAELGAEAAIVGRALYERKFQLAEAISYVS